MVKPLGSMPMNSKNTLKKPNSISEEMSNG